MVSYEILENLPDEARAFDEEIDRDALDPNEAAFMLGYELDALRSIEG